MNNKILKKDKYQKKRGGKSRFLKIFCEKCGAFICDYQKDGDGELKRLYIDRILKPKVIWKDGKKLICKKKSFTKVANNY